LQSGATPLLIASACGHLEVVRELLSRGAAVGAAAGGGATPLFAASGMGHLGVVRELLAHGAAVDDANAALATPLHAACFAGSLEVARELLARGAVVDTAVPVRELIARGARLGVREGDLHASIRQLLRGYHQNAALNKAAWGGGRPVGR
jgi:ankyrin repeat protein